MQPRAGDWLSFAHMVENFSNSVATAIHGAEFEGFIAGTLFNQGWNVTFRALDVASLLTYLEGTSKPISLLLISTDVEGLTPETLEEIKAKGVRFFLFASSNFSAELFPEAISQPASSLELLGLIRGSLRTPMIRAAQKEKIRAKTIAIASPTPASGCTTLAINVGAELAQLGKRVLIVDAHSYFPAFAIRLGERGLTDSMELRNISNQLWAFEVTQGDISGALSALERARFEFDFIIVDAGVIKDFPAILSGRRWCGEIFIWVTTFADELWVMCKTDFVSLERLKKFTAELSRNSIKPNISFIQFSTGATRKSKSDSDQFLQCVTPLRPSRVLIHPWDFRNVVAAEEERRTLLDTNERGILRKSIRHLAGELVS
jgi:hypothetical protein